MRGLQPAKKRQKWGSGFWVWSLGCRGGIVSKLISLTAVMYLEVQGSL